MFMYKEKYKYNVHDVIIYDMVMGIIFSYEWLVLSDSHKGGLKPDSFHLYLTRENAKRY